MTTPVERRGPLLEARVISRHTAEVVPDPLEQLVALFDAAEARRVHGLQLGGLRVVERVVRLHVARAHNQYVAELELRALPLEDLLQPLQLDRRALERAEGLRALHVPAGPVFAPPREVEQHAAPHDPVFLQVLHAQDVRLRARALGRAGDVLDRRVVVEALGCLVAEVAEAVPLRGGLRVEVPGVVVDYAGLLLVDVFFEDLAAEEGAVAWGF